MENPSQPERKETQPVRTNVLAVEDSGPLSRLYQVVFGREGFGRYNTFTSPQEALKEFTEHSDEYDAIVTDFNMPGMNGGELIVKAKEIKPNITSILFSSNTREDLGEEADMFDLLIDKRDFSVEKAPDIANQMKQTIEKNQKNR